jgi:glycine/D-amino acid oxidase-like deaminating enzyme
MLSFWETTQLTRFDLVVIGGGLVGLSTAIHFRKANPNARIAILERGVFPSGASTKNAGFLCFGSIDELSDHLEEMPQDELLALVERRYRGGLRLRELLGDQRIGYEPCGGYELHTHQLDHTVIERFNDMLRPLFAENVYQDVTHEIQSKGFSSDRVTSLIRNQFEGVIHTGKMIRSYQEVALEHGIMTFTQTECQQYHEKEDAVDVEITHLGERMTLSTQKLALCTNAFTSRWLPKRILPQDVDWCLLPSLEKALICGDVSTTTLAIIISGVLREGCYLVGEGTSIKKPSLQPTQVLTNTSMMHWFEICMK